jgi:hypothetical protein
MGGGMGAKGTRLVPSLDRYHQSASSSSLVLVRSVLPLWSFLKGLGKMGKETDRDGAGDPGGPLPADFLGENIPRRVRNRQKLYRREYLVLLFYSSVYNSNEPQ